MSSCRRLLLRVCLDAFLMLNAAHALLHLAWDLHRPSLQPPPVAQSSLPCQRSGTARKLCTAFSKRTMSRAEPATLWLLTPRRACYVSPPRHLCQRYDTAAFPKYAELVPSGPSSQVGWLAAAAPTWETHTHTHPAEHSHLSNVCTYGMERRDRALPPWPTKPTSMVLLSIIKEWNRP